MTPGGTLKSIIPLLPLFRRLQRLFGIRLTSFAAAAVDVRNALVAGKQGWGFIY
jgi:hypothetical protein